MSRQKNSVTRFSDHFLAIKFLTHFLVSYPTLAFFTKTRARSRERERPNWIGMASDSILRLLRQFVPQKISRAKTLKFGFSPTLWRKKTIAILKWALNWVLESSSLAFERQKVFLFSLFFRSFGRHEINVASCYKVDFRHF